MQEKMQDFSPIKKRILQYIDSKGITVYKFYKESGITRGILAQSNGISEENITKFLAYSSDINPSWLLTGSGDMLLNHETNFTIASKSNDVASQLRDSRSKVLQRSLAANNANWVDTAHARKLNRLLEKKHPDLYKITVSLDTIFWFNDASDAIRRTLGDQVDNAFRSFKGDFDFKAYEQNVTDVLNNLAPFAPPINQLGEAINKFYADMSTVPGNTIDFEDFIVE